MYYSQTAKEKPELRDFWNYVAYKGISDTDLNNMPLKKKEELFYLWKWGGSVHDHNMQCEFTRINLTKDIMDMDVTKDPETDAMCYWRDVVKFERYCLEIKKNLGIFVSNKIGEKVDWQE